MTAQEVDEFFSELNYLTILNLLSATEAAIRVDFWDRVSKREIDSLSRRFRRLVKSEGKISLRKHILESWIWNDPGLSSNVADLRAVMKVRDWLAHGRYWIPKFGRTNYSPADVFDTCDRLLRQMCIE